MMGGPIIFDHWIHFTHSLLPHKVMTIDILLKGTQIFQPGLTRQIFHSHRWRRSYQHTTLKFIFGAPLSEVKTEKGCSRMSTVCMKSQSINGTCCQALGWFSLFTVQSWHTHARIHAQDRKRRTHSETHPLVVGLRLELDHIFIFPPHPLKEYSIYSAGFTTHVY